MNFEEIVPNTSMRRARHHKGWTQSNLAEALGTSFETVSRWERGITTPSPYFRERLCAVLGHSAQGLGLDASSDGLIDLTSLEYALLACAHADAGHESIASLEIGLQAQNIALYKSHLIKRQGASNPKKRLREAIGGARLIVLIASPRGRTSRNVNEALQLASTYKRPVCALWVEGERLQDCISAASDEFLLTIDAREGYDACMPTEMIAALTGGV